MCPFAFPFNLEFFYSYKLVNSALDGLSLDFKLFERIP